MIRVTRLNGSAFFVNAEMIKFIEETPDTVITLTDATKLIVREPAEALVKSIVSYRQQTHQSPWGVAGQ